MSTLLQTRPVHTASELAPHLEDWRALASGAPMRSPEWLLGWWDIYAGPDDELRIVLVTDSEDALVGLAPLYLRNKGWVATFRVLGASDHCTHHTDWLSAEGSESRVGTAVARYLLECGQDWKRLLFEAVDADAEAIRTTLHYLTEQGCLGHQRQINSCWTVRLPETWDDYLRTLSRSLRKRCRKLQRQFLDSGKIRIHQAENEADLQKGFEVLLELHAARWGSPGQPLGVFSDPKFRTFHETVSRRLMAEGKLRLAWLVCEGKPVAVEYQFVDEKSVYAYQAGLDLSMDAYSPGKLSMMAAIRFAIDRGCSSFDLLGGDEPYKAHWRAVPTACHDLRIWHRNIKGYLEWTVWNVYMMAARRLKAVLPAHRTGQLSRQFHGMKEALLQRGVKSRVNRWPLSWQHLIRGLKHAFMLLYRRQWREFLTRVRIALGQIDLRVDPTEAVSERTHYYADSGGPAFDRIMSHFEISSSDAIVDFGCGKGGILISLSKYPFSRITGVEISTDLVDIARENIRKLKIGNVDVQCCDAADFKQLDEYNYFYFFDPFPPVVMTDVLDNIERSLIDRPRKVTLIYLNPFCHELIEGRAVFSKTETLDHFEHDCFIYTNRS